MNTSPRRIVLALGVVAVASVSSSTQAAPVKLDFISEKTPREGPVLLSRDGARFLVFEQQKRLGCNPQDTYGAGECDWKARAVIRRVAGGKKVGQFSFIWGRWRKKTDQRALARQLAAFAEPRAAVQQSDQRRYELAGYYVVIDGHGRAVRLRVLPKAGGTPVFQKKLRGRCKARGKKTIWGADIYGYSAHKLLFVKDPRACKRRMVVVVRLP